MNLKRSLDETVHDLFIKQLYSGKYHIGQRIDPAELAAQFSISRTPVVQALKLLASERVLVVDRGGKYFITVPTEKMLRDVCDVRCLMEQYAISLLLKEGNRAGLEELREIAVESKRQFEEGEKVEGIQCCQEFHKMFMRKTGNHCLVEAYLPVLCQFGGIKYALGNEWKSHEGLGNWHLQIMDCLLDGREEEAKKITREHIDICCEDVVQAILKLDLKK